MNLFSRLFTRFFKNKLKTFPCQRNSSEDNIESPYNPPLFNPDFEHYRLSLPQAIDKIIDKKSDGSPYFKYIYLLFFDSQDRLLFHYLLLPDAPPESLNALISCANLVEEKQPGIYYLLKVRNFRDYFEGFIDSQGFVAKIKGFIDAWLQFYSKPGGDNPALQRYTVEFVNQKLGLPFRYSEKQRARDLKEVL